MFTAIPHLARPFATTAIADARLLRLRRAGANGTIFFVNPHPAQPIATILVVWFVMALGIGFTGRVAELRPPTPQVVLVVLTVTALAAVLLVPRLRTWADHGSLRVLTSVHVSRFVGVYFLLLAQRGTLAPAFALPAGWGDVAVATGALVLILSVKPRTASGRLYYSVWNIVGLIDILLVVILAARIGLSDPVSLRPLLRLPLCLLPTFLVPVIIVSHILLFRRLRALHLLPR